MGGAQRRLLEGVALSRQRRAALLATTALAGALALPSGEARATDFTWVGGTSNDYNTSSNWSPAGVPNASDTAFFGVSATTSLSNPAIGLNVGGWTFNAGAPAYDFTIDNINFSYFSFFGAGIVINGGSATITNNSILQFFNSSTAGSATITNNRLLQFLNSSTAGSATITNNSHLIFLNFSTAGGATITNNSGGTTYFAGSASGGIARFILNGAGALDISPLTAGGTTAGSIEGDGDVFLGSKNLTVGGNDLSTIFSGVIQDGGLAGAAGGSLTKEGAGALTLNGVNAYTGATVVNGGTLLVNGSIASSSGLTVNAGGIIGGVGFLPSTIIASGGALAPGNSIGTITVNGNLTFNAGSVYAVEVSPSAADRTNVTGTAALAGAVGAAFAPGAYLTRSYTILSAAGGLGGSTFDTLATSNLPVNFNASLSYTTNDVLLNIKAALGSGAILNANQFAVANTINNYFNNGGALPPGFATLFGLTGGNLSNALSQTSGEAATGAQRSAFQLMNEFLGSMVNRDFDEQGETPSAHPLAYAPSTPAARAEATRALTAVIKTPRLEQPRWRVWGSGFGGSNVTRGNVALGSHKVTTSTYGAAAGLDYRLTPDTLIGLALGGGGVNWGLAEGLGGGRSDAFQAGLYGKTHAGPAYVSAALAFANHWMSTDRYAFGGNRLKANFTAYDIGGRIEGGYRFGAQTQAITPYAAFQAQSFNSPHYSETDLTFGGFGLTYASRSATNTRSELGARFDQQIAVANGADLRLGARFAWAHNWVSNPSLNAVFQTLPGSNFIVNGAIPPKNSALVTAGAELRLAGGLSLLARFDGDFAASSQTYAGLGTLRYVW
jgi:outer membrane autotransporter protein